MATFRAPATTHDFIAAAAVTSGDVVVDGSLVGIATADVATGDVGAMVISGLVDGLPTASGQVWTIGTPVYWDTDNDQVVASAGSGHVLMGRAAGAKSGGTTTPVAVYLNLG